MKKKVKVYFDFLCPYCYVGVHKLIELLPEFPDLVMDWEACEAHPRPEERALYSDLASEAFHYIKGHHGDCLAFIKAVYHAFYLEKKRIDDKDVLLECAKDTGIEIGRLKASLIRRDYKQDVMANNEEIWDIYEASAVPALYCRNKKLVSVEDHLLSEEDLRAFLQSL